MDVGFGKEIHGGENGYGSLGLAGGERGVQGKTTFGESYWEVHGGFNRNNFLGFLASKQFHSAPLQDVALCAQGI